MGAWNNPYVEPFARQFEADGETYLYRKYQRDAPVRVTGDERDGFVADFGRRMKTYFSVMMALMIGMPILAVALAIWVSEDFVVPVTLAGMAMAFLFFSWFVTRGWNVATRATVGRPVVGERRSRAEMTPIRLRSVSYLWLALMGVFGLFLLWRFSDPSVNYGGWGRIGLAVPVGMLCMVVVQGFRKWRIERAG